MKQKVTLNGIDIEVEITKEMARKVLEESEEIKDGDRYWFKGSTGVINDAYYYDGTTSLGYLQEQDNFLPSKTYTEQQAKEYFDKRDARRAAEYRIKKAIEKMNGDKERNCEIVYVPSNTTHKFIVNKTGLIQHCSKDLMFNYSIGDYILEHHTEDYKIYFGIK